MTTTSGTSSSSLIQNYINTHQTSTSSTSSSSSSSSSSSTSASGMLSANMNTFLKILTTQLQNQDPTEATNTDQFTQELVQFAQVEQQIQTNDKLDDLITIQSPNGVTPLLNYVGKTVEADADGKFEVQGGYGEFSYTLGSAAQTVSLTIKNSAGKTVATASGLTTKGSHKIAWQAADSSGNALDDGTYSVAVTAKDSNGKEITVSDINMIGVVTSIQTDSDGTTTLSMGDTSIAASKIKAVYYTNTGSSSSSTASTSSSSSSSSTSST